ncbi:MAG: hypothetical protein HQ522_21005 [Bacteroidetes bacterium]|nr:hypothetical protein [Bacteroidota bacterium]
MKCKLCKQDKNLLRRSHIIPDFMYKGLFNEKHFIAPINLIAYKKNKLVPTGYYDSNILCEKCDNQIIGNLESYSSIVIWGGKGSEEKHPIFEQKINQLNQKYLHLINIDYTKFKLFLLSILWRAAISEQNFFKSVSLGEHEKKIREMIFNNKPEKSSDYPVGLFVLSQNKNSPSKMIANPIKIKSGENLAYHFLINGFVIVYKVEGNDDFEFYEQIKIKEDNTMDVYIFDEKDSQEYMDDYLKRKLRYKKYIA